MSDPTFTAGSLATMSYREMQQLCKDHSLKASGKSGDLKERLEALLTESSAAALAEPLADTTNKESPTKIEKPANIGLVAEDEHVTHAVISTVEPACAARGCARRCAQVRARARARFRARVARAHSPR